MGSAAGVAAALAVRRETRAAAAVEDTPGAVAVVGVADHWIAMVVAAVRMAHAARVDSGVAPLVAGLPVRTVVAVVVVVHRTAARAVYLAAG